MAHRIYTKGLGIRLRLLMATLLVALMPILQEVRVRAATYTLFSSSSTPAVAVGTDNQAVELGIKFTSDVNGSVTGVRFYKGDTTNGGIHYGHLWSATGTQLAEAQFVNETNSGWQDVSFAAPVNISANTTYIVSYYAPQGHYSYTSQGMSAAVDNAPLHGLANSASPNGTYAYTAGAHGTFPGSSYNATNYWVDVDFSPTTVPGGVQNIWPSASPANADSGDANAVNIGVKFQSSTAGYISGIRFYKGTALNGGTHVGQLWSSTGSLLAQATFAGESSSGWQDVRFNGTVPVKANTTYIASYFAPQGHYSYDGANNPNGLSATISNPPLSALSSGSSGGNGVYVYGTAPGWPTQTYNSTNYWVDVDFTTTYTAPTPAAQATPRAGVRGAGPLLVLTDPTNPFTDIYCNALFKTEGLPECAATDTANLTPGFSLSGYRTIVLADGAPLTSAQINQVTQWVNSGGTLIAMKPDDGLDSLLGIGQRTQDSLFDAYYQVNATLLPGIETQTMQYHGAADQHPLASAQALATLYSSGTTATSYPAITANTVGAGKAVGIMFDIAKSAAYLRDGNPGLAGQSALSTDGQPRIIDRFAYGWLDTNKAAIPQADEQQRILANLVEGSTLPRLWYFPAYQGGVTKAALILTGDDHASSSQTLSRFAAETAASPAGCSVANWTCYTSTSYAFPNAFSDSAAKPYTDQGFEVSPHIATSTGGCMSDWTTQAQLDGQTASAIQAWQSSYPSVSAAYPPQTERYHCYGIQKDYASMTNVEAAHGIKADTNSSCWPNSFLNVGQCLFTGSGMPQQYTDAAGNLTGVYQFTTQATDENAPTITQGAMNTLVGNATGTNAYYGYFTVLCHLDNLAASNQCASDTLTVAQNNHIPMVSARQAEQFWDGRNAAATTNLSYGPTTLSFTTTTPISNIQQMVPTAYGGKSLASITINGASATYATLTVSGLTYAILSLAGGSNAVVATYN